jgi:hypothetical protein
MIVKALVEQDSPRFRVRLFEASRIVRAGGVPLFLVQAQRGVKEEDRSPVDKPGRSAIGLCEGFLLPLAFPGWVVGVTPLRWW